MGYHLQFPVWIVIGPLRLHPHPVLEALGYALGFRLYLYLRRTGGGTPEVEA